MKKSQYLWGCAFVLCGLLMQQTTAHAQSDVTQPGDPLTASTDNSPGSERGPNAIDNQPTKYLNFDTTGIDGIPSGFVVTPAVGMTLLTGISLQSANDAVERDPKWMRLEGSNDEAPTWEDGDWKVIYENNAIQSWPELFPDGDRFQTQTFSFENDAPFLHYRWTVVEVQGENANSMQIAEVELLGGVLPGDVTQPGDALTASTDNSPGSERGPNAIDDQPTKYLNFDTTGVDPIPSGFVVTPGIGRTVVSGLTMQSANDATERDPKWVRLEGSNDDAPTWESGNWDVIYENDEVPAWTDLFPDGDRFQTQTFTFAPVKPYSHYRWTVVIVQGENANSMQIAEVELLGTSAPEDVTQPGDPLTASSDNSPGSERAPNAIDNQPTKYLNFDTTGVDPIPSGFVVSPVAGGIEGSTVIGITLQSANDAVERDPLSMRLEGSNDAAPTWESGNWTVIYENDEITPWPELFPDGDRFQTQEFFFFDHNTAYLHYRWTVLQVQGENANSMQIAEVELLVGDTGTECPPAMFLTVPVDTPVLDGESAEFFTKVNGPWTVQWSKNGEPIAGAIQTAYTTGPITAANEGDLYTAVIVGDGCEPSEPVKAFVFTPPAPLSIGVNFVGGGANGAPTRVEPTDIGGDQLQASWNNLPLEDDGTPAGIEEDLLNGRNETTEISVDWMSGARWGAGTGTDNTNAKLLNGLIEGGDNEDIPSTIIFAEVPDGIYSLLIYSIARPDEFPTIDFEQVESGQRIYMTQENADAYNANPGFRQVSSTDPENRGEGNFVRFDDITPVDGEVTLNFWDEGDGAANSTINAMQLIEALGDPLRFTDIQFHSATRNVDLTWTSREGRTYTMARSTDLSNWQELTDGIESGGDTTSYTDPNVPADLDPVYYQVTEE